MCSMNDLPSIDEVFTKYGYEQREIDENQYVIYSSGTSMYPAIEVVVLEHADSLAIEKIKTNYSAAGYAVRVCNVSTIDEIESYLFNL